MIGRIWRWLKRLFRRLFGGKQDTHPTMANVPPLKPLDDTDLEYLFRQLLEGVAHGWQQPRILKFFEALNGRTTKTEWVAWIERFGAGVLASRSSNYELALRMVRLGEIIGSMPSMREIGEAAYQIGSQILTKEHTGLVWEYDGPDADSTVLAPVPNPSGEPINPQIPEGKVITVDELLVKLQQDPHLVELVAQELGIETNDPEVIIQEVNKQLDAVEQSATD